MAGSSLSSHYLTPTTIKFLCSYGGRILPRYTDGKLRYHGGETRLLSVDSSVTFSELLVKMREMCGSSVSLRCQLPTEDLDALVSITSDEDLANLIEEYDRAAAAPSSSFKIRAFLSVPKAVSRHPTASSFGSHTSTLKLPSRLYPGGGGGGIPPRYPYKRISAARPIISQKVAGKISAHFAHHYPIGQGKGCGVGRLVHNGNHWQ